MLANYAMYTYMFFALSQLSSLIHISASLTNVPLVYRHIQLHNYVFTKYDTFFAALAELTTCSMSDIPNLLTQLGTPT